MPEDQTRLSDREKILVGLAAAVGAGCRTCIDRLRVLARDARIPGDELEHALAEGLHAREASTATLRAKVASLFGRSPRREPGDGKELRIAELCRLASATAANSAPDAQRYAAAARTAGATETAIDVTIGIARSVRSKAQGFSDEELGAVRAPEPCPSEQPVPRSKAAAARAPGAERGTALAGAQASEMPCECSQPGGAPCGPMTADTGAERVARQERTVWPATAAGPPWEHILRPIESLPLGHLWLALGLTAAVAALYLAWCAAFDAADELVDASQPLSLAIETRIHLTIAVLIAFFVATRRYIDQRSPLELSRLQPLTCCSREELARIASESRLLHRRRLRAAQVIGALVGLCVLPAAMGDPADFLRAQAWDARMVWGAATSALLFALMGGAAYETVVDRRTLGRVTREISQINLLDEEALEPFARQGLRRAFFWAGGSTIASLLALEVRHLWPLLAVLAGTLFLATLAFLEPARSVRARLRDAKRVELSRVRAEILRAKEAALRSADDPETSRLSGLLAYESRIEAVGEWPIDVPTLARFAALALLATGSWLGGALVERVLSAVLD